MKDAVRYFPADAAIPSVFAYVEWFTPFEAESRPPHHLWQTKLLIVRGERVATLIPVGKIQRSVHLFPSFGPEAPSDWNSGNVLDRCTKFFVNAFQDRHAYHIFG